MPACISLIKMWVDHVVIVNLCHRHKNVILYLFCPAEETTRRDNNTEIISKKKEGDDGFNYDAAVRILHKQQINTH